MEKNRSYPIENSPLYGINSKKKLSELLYVKPSSLERLTDDKNYFISKTKGEKPRDTQTPDGKLRTIHERMKKLLSRLETPSYLFSGVKGRSYIKNAQYHLDGNDFLVIDIKSFYQSSQSEYVFRFFHYQMKMGRDIAKLVSDLLTYKGFIPTGSPVSQLLAYWTFFRVFNKLDDIAKENKLRFSLYVDDMVFSSENKIPPTFYLKVKYQLNQVGLDLKKEKLRHYTVDKYKRVTGCIITPNHQLITPNKIRKKLIGNLKIVDATPIFESLPKKSLLGLISSIQLIEPTAFEQTKNRIKRMNTVI